MNAIATLLPLLAQAQEGGDWSPQGLYPVDSLFKLFALWAIMDLYGWIFLFIFPLTVFISVFARYYAAVRKGQGIGPPLEYMVWALIILFFLWPVQPTIAAPLFGGSDEDLQALEEAKKNLIDENPHKWSGVPRILMWGMAIHDTLFHQVITKVRALNARPIGEREYLRIRLAHAVPLDKDLQAASGIYWALCYEKAIANMQAAQQNGGGTNPAAVMPLDPALDQHFPPFGEEEWETLAGAIPQGELIEDAGSCQGLREQLLSDYADEIEEDEHEKLLEDLRDPNKGNVQFTDDEYKGYLVRQSVSANSSIVYGTRAVLDWDGTDHDLDTVPVNDDDPWYYRWPSSALNWVLDWWGSGTAAWGVHTSLPTVAKQTAEVSRMLAPSLYGVAMMLVILIFPFVSIAIVAGSYRALFSFYRLFLATAMTPLLWELLTSFEIFFAQRNYAGLASFMGDGSTYANVAIPFLFAAAPMLSTFIVYSAFAFGGGGGGGGGANPMVGATYQTAQAGRGASRRQEETMNDMAVGTLRGGAGGAAGGAVDGFMIGGPAGAMVGAAGQGGKGAVGGFWDGATGESNPGHDGGAWNRHDRAVVNKVLGEIPVVGKMLGSGEKGADGGEGGDDGGGGGGAAAGEAEGGEAAAAAAV